MVSFKPQTKTLSRGPVLEVGDALSTWPPSAHHTLAHMHGPLPPPWVRGWQTSLVTGGWLLPTGAGSPPWEATGPWGAIPSMNLGSHGFPPPHRAWSAKFLFSSLCSTAFHMVSQTRKGNENHGLYVCPERALGSPRNAQFTGETWSWRAGQGGMHVCQSPGKPKSLISMRECNVRG